MHYCGISSVHRYSKAKHNFNVLLLKSFIHKAYLRNNYMFRPLIVYPIRDNYVVSNRIYDQPDDGLEKRPKHVAVPKIRYVNKAP
jgi:hypothetical protein